MNQPLEPDRIDCRLFGALSVRVNDQEIDIGTPKQRLVLAILCLAESVVSVETLTESLWSGPPPASARKNIQIYVSRLRRIFGPRLTHSVGGYRLRLSEEEFDLVRFHRAVDAGHAALEQGDGQSATQCLERAIVCWGAGPLPEFEHEPQLAPELQHLTERFLGVLEDWAELMVDRGGYRAVLAILDRFARQHWLRERLAVGWMRALADAGRSGEALSYFDSVRQTLNDELGIDPGRRLTEIYQRLLRGETIGAGALPSGADENSWPAAAVVLHHIPRDLRNFVGREAEIQEVWRAFTAHHGSDVMLLTGGVGVGKTALAVRLAHRLGEPFPDGRIMVEMAGPDGRARNLDVILRELLDMAGFESDPVRTQANALAMWRSWAAGRKLLLIMDDAIDEDTVRMLLPTAGAARTIVTSRRRLSGLESVSRLEISGLTEAESLDLLARIVGPDQIRLDQEAARELVGFSEGSPLAIQIVGSRLTMSRHRTPAGQLFRLKHGRSILDELVAGKLDFRSRYSQLHRSLTSAQRTACRRIIRLGGPPFERAEVFGDLQSVMADAALALETLRESYLLWTSSEDASNYQMSKFCYAFLREQYSPIELRPPKSYLPYMEFHEQSPTVTSMIHQRRSNGS